MSGRLSPEPGLHIAQFVVGACATVGAQREVRRWAPLLDDAFSAHQLIGEHAGAALIRGYGRRRAKKIAVRMSRRERKLLRQRADRGLRLLPPYLGRGAS